MSQLQLCLHHELILLVLDDAKGSFKGVMYQYGLAGALLSELLLQGVIKVSADDEQIVAVAIAKPTGDPLLDEVVKMIAESEKPQALKQWVYKAANIPKLCERVADQLCQLGILRFEESKVLWLFTKKRYPELDSSYDEAIRSRMAEVMFKPELKADDRTTVLIAIAKSCKALAANFAPVELSKHESRINEICDGKQLAIEATGEAIAAVQASMAAIYAANTANTAATAAISAANI